MHNAQCTILLVPPSTYHVARAKRRSPLPAPRAAGAPLTLNP